MALNTGTGGKKYDPVPGNKRFKDRRIPKADRRQGGKWKGGHKLPDDGKDRRIKARRSNIDRRQKVEE